MYMNIELLQSFYCYMTILLYCDEYVGIFLQFIALHTPMLIARKAIATLNVHVHYIFVHYWRA